MTWQQIVDALGLAPHPEEGGYYRETYRSPGRFEPGAPFDGVRSVGTAIYYLLTPDTYSALHRLPGDEIFHHYLGDPVEMLLLRPDGSSELQLLSSDLGSGRPQRVVPGGVWQGSRLVEGGEFALLGTTMAPGFQFEDYESGGSDLAERHPDRRALIDQLLPGGGARAEPS
ncbi:MAG: cupin domain-containing protein [Gemmatimonadota bacterium]|jgi:predicted cupin superfamily sugar epimerase